MSLKKKNFVHMVFSQNHNIPGAPGLFRSVLYTKKYTKECLSLTQMEGQKVDRN